MPNVTIRELPTVTLPITAADTFLETSVLENGIEVSRKIAADDLQTAIGLDASFVTIGLNAALPNERVITAGTDISVVDGGAGTTVTINFTGVSLPVSSAGDVTLRGDGSGGWVESNRIRITFSGIFQILGPGLANTFLFSNDDTDAVINTVGLTDLRVRNFTGINLEDGVVLNIQDLTNADTLSLLHNGTDARINTDAGTLRIGAEGEVEDFVVIGNDAGSGSPVRRLVLRDFDTNGTMNYGIEFQEADTTPTGFFGYGFGTLTVLQMLNRFNDGQLQLRVTDGGGTARPVLTAIPASNITSLFDGSQNNANVQIPVFSQGSLLARNEKTGPASTERVMTGADRPALVEEYEFDVSTDTATDPGTNDFRMNNAIPASVTQIAVDDLFLAQIGDFGDYWGPELVIGDRILIKQKNDGTRWILVQLTGVPVDQTGFWNFNVSVVDSGLIFTGGDECSFEFSPLSLGGGATVLPGTVDGQVLRWDNPNTQWEVTTGVFMEATGQPPIADQGYIRLISTATSDVRRSQIFAESQNTQSVFAFWETAATDGFYQRIVGNGADRIVWGREITSVDTDMMSLREDTTIRIETGGNFMIQERAAARTAIAGLGEIWVRNDAPNNLIFTDDAGTDHLLNGAGGSLPVGTVTDAVLRWSGSAWVENTDVRIDLSANLILESVAPHLDLRETGATVDEGNWIFRADADLLRISTASDASPTASVANAISISRTGTALDSMAIGSPIKIAETAAADADTAGFGQISVLSSTPNVLRFTDDTGGESFLGDDHLRLTESAAIAAPTAGFGSYAVRDHAPNQAAFATDIDQEFALMNVATDFDYEFSTTTTSGDPGNGVFRYNNATPASITEIFIDDLTQFIGGMDWTLADLIPGDILEFVTIQNDARYQRFRVNALITDNTGWFTIPVEPINSGTLHNNAESVRLVIHKQDPVSTPDINPTGFTLDAASMHETTVKNNTTAFTITCAAAGVLTFEVGASHDVYNRGASGDITIADGGEALIYLDGSSATDVGANATLGPGGAATIYREAAGTYILTGTGITP